MATYKELQAQIENLQKQAEEARRVEIEEALKKVRELIRAHGLTIADIGKRTFAAAGIPKAGKKPAVAAKYRNPATGESWSGRGPRPGWIKKALEEGRADEYLVDRVARPPAKKAAAKKVKAAAKKAPAKKASSK